MEMMVHHQNTMLALRVEMGWPSFKPANDCLAFSSGGVMDVDVGMELARIAQMLNKDVIYAGWTSHQSKKPTGFSLAYREMLTVDIIDRLLPYAANDSAPISLVSISGNEFFAIDPRGTLNRLAGKPKNIGKGSDLAMRRIKARAAAMGKALLANNRYLPTGQDWMEPEAPTDTVIRFG